MRTDAKTSFSRDIKKISPVLQDEVYRIIEIVENAKTLQDIPELKKMRASNTAYRIRIRKYRIGIIIDNDIVVFDRCLPRKDFYKYFP